jgi:hypothetical protein
VPMIAATSAMERPSPLSSRNADACASGIWASASSTACAAQHRQAAPPRKGSPHLLMRREGLCFGIVVEALLDLGAPGTHAIEKQPARDGVGPGEHGGAGAVESTRPVNPQKGLLGQVLG